MNAGTRGLLRSAVTPVWALLMAATAINFWLGVDHGFGSGSAEIATVVIMALAFIKVRFIGMYFMELRHAPQVMALLFQGWCLVVGSAVLIFYLAK